MSLLTNSTIMDRFEYSDILGYDYEEEVDDVDFQLLNQLIKKGKMTCKDFLNVGGTSVNYIMCF